VRRQIRAAGKSDFGWISAIHLKLLARLAISRCREPLTPSLEASETTAPYFLGVMKNIAKTPAHRQTGAPGLAGVLL